MSARNKKTGSKNYWDSERDWFDDCKRSGRRNLCPCGARNFGGINQGLHLASYDDGDVWVNHSGGEGSK